MTESQRIKGVLIKHGKVLGYRDHILELSQIEFRDLCVVTMLYLYGFAPTVVNDHYFKFVLPKGGEVRMFCYAKQSKVTIKTVEAFLADAEVGYKKRSENDYWYLCIGPSSENADELCNKRKLNMCDSSVILFYINLAIESYNKTVDHYKPLWEKEEKDSVERKRVKVVEPDTPIIYTGKPNKKVERSWTDITFDDLLFWDMIDDD